MEERILKNTPRVGLGGPVDTRESHTSSEVCRAYTGPAQNALEGVEAAAAASGGGGASSRDGPKPALLTAPVANILTTNDNSRHTARSPVVQLERLLGLEGGSRVTTPVSDIDLALSTASEGESGSRVLTPVSTGTVRSGLFFKPGIGSDESDSESAVSQNKDDDMHKTKDRFRRKRRGSELEDSPEKNRGAARKPSSKRGRGRPPTTGMYVGLAKAKKDFNDEEMRAMQLEAEKEIFESGRRIPQFRAGRLSGNSSNSDATAVEAREVTAASVGVVITECLGAINSVAVKSKNLKGTSVATLKKATQALSEAFSAIMNRSVSDETRALEAANARLSREINEMKAELEAVKRKLADAQPQPTPVSIGRELDVEELLQRAVREAVSLTNARMDARLEGLEARLLPEPRLRPPLAADKKNDEAQGAAVAASKAKERTPEPEHAVSTLMPPLNPGPALKKKKKVNKKSAAAVEAAAARRDTAPSTAAKGPNPTEQWSEVVKRGGKIQKKGEGKKEGPKQKGQAKKKRKRKSLRAPKTAAVVITLQEGAEKRGVTYKDVMDKAKGSLDIVTLEIPAVKFKRAVTGARMYEVSGSSCKEKADTLASKLREVLGEEDVRISRPQKCAELRISGMDDSATASEVAAAIARAGCCAAEDIKVGEIRVDRSGCGTAWVKCPVEAAKVVTAPGAKLYVGWTMVRVTLLSARVMRCYRCHEVGHTRATCPSDTDRGDLCFRCGQPGHTIKTCGNPPHCALCAANGRKADHVVGSTPCKIPRKKGKGSNKSQSPKAATPTTVASGAGVAPMEAQ
ncbi:uncharacterized protein LOC121736779 [Aricia agestis]|uniref:uncharacterized protein LOC121736772 n=1 Tax=Aricia agestis TaxID=91739 RepID=UPI001C204A63|nr:uncharacterized protein LOC121736772 [Aricia agestis]XP_041984093.1 uncharacterized protein LOC121736775 [Aricia agestis]XP_041984096.1 uncharacterized protein LOC121736779 [Aricia agestis]